MWDPDLSDHTPEVVKASQQNLRMHAVLLGLASSLGFRVLGLGVRLEG